MKGSDWIAIVCTKTVQVWIVDWTAECADVVGAEVTNELYLHY